MVIKKDVVVLGGGVGGLAVAYYLSRTNQYNVIVLEKTSEVGGLSASFHYNGFTLDFGAHKLYSTLPRIMDEINDIFDGDLLKLPKRNKIFLRGKLLDYPLKLSNLAKVIGLFGLFQIGLGFALELFLGLINRSPALSYEDYMIKRFGRPAYELVFEPLADKVWGQPATLHADMARTRVPASGGLDIIFKLLGLKKESVETNAEFFLYPKNGFGGFPQRLKEKSEKAGSRVILNAQIKKIKLESDKAVGVMAAVDGQERFFPCDYLVSTIPLQAFAPMILSRPVERLESRHLILVYLFVDRPLVLNDQWIFFPEKNFVFSRIFEQKQMNSDLVPADQTSICCDFTCAEESWQWQAGDDELAKKCVEGLIGGGFVKAAEVTGCLVKRFDNFYPRYDLNYESGLAAIFSEIKQTNNVLLSGRVGMYNYNNCDHCLDMALFISDKLLAGESPPEILDSLTQRVKNYKIVD